jgi:hypothetical protein
MVDVVMAGFLRQALAVQVLAVQVLAASWQRLGSAILITAAINSTTVKYDSGERRTFALGIAARAGRSRRGDI